MGTYDNQRSDAISFPNSGAAAAFVAPEIVRALGERWYGHYGLARCPAHDDSRPSLSVAKRDNRVLVRCHAGCPQAEVIDALRARGLWPSIFENKGPCPDAGSRRCSGEVPRQKWRTQVARRIWQESQLIVGTRGQDYLRARGITAVPPASLRYAPSLLHGPTGRFLPAIVAAVTIWPSYEIVCVHRIFLEADGLRKAQVSPAKLTLGPSAGGAVRLAPVDDCVWLTEGIEDAMSLIQMAGVPAWAVIGTSGFKNIILSERITTVILAPDGDKAGQDAIGEAANRLAGQGREVRIARPKAKDWNEALPDFEERAAIMELDGGRDREIAEATAGREVAR